MLFDEIWQLQRKVHNVVKRETKELQRKVHYVVAFRMAKPFS